MGEQVSVRIVVGIRAGAAERLVPSGCLRIPHVHRVMIRLDLRPNTPSPVPHFSPMNYSEDEYE